MNVIKAQIDIIKKLFDKKTRVVGYVDSYNKKVYFGTSFYAYSIPLMDCMINMERIKDSSYLSQFFSPCDIGKDIHYTGYIKENMLIFEDDEHFQFGVNKKFLDSVDIKKYTEYRFTQKEKLGVVYISYNDSVQMAVMPIKLK